MLLSENTKLFNNIHESRLYLQERKRVIVFIEEYPVQVLDVGLVEPRPPQPRPDQPRLGTPPRLAGLAVLTAMVRRNYQEQSRSLASAVDTVLLGTVLLGTVLLVVVDLLDPLLEFLHDAVRPPGLPQQGEEVLAWVWRAVVAGLSPLPHYPHLSSTGPEVVPELERERGERVRDEEICLTSMSTWTCPDLQDLPHLSLLHWNLPVIRRAVKDCQAPRQYLSSKSSRSISFTRQNKNKQSHPHLLETVEDPWH